MTERQTLATAWGHHGTYQWSEADQVWHGRVETIDNDIISFEADTEEKIEAAFRQAVLETRALEEIRSLTEAL
ncbi:hypothetical protein BRX37_16705 [Sphingomonas sp. S-NIH.Pt3_0716]|nr:hypothetical protein BRX37_16705 [Sphingomonas sp. S-NIH.Pt3_0716]